MKRELNLVRFHTMKDEGFIETIVHEGQVFLQVFYSYTGNIVNIEIKKL